MKPRRKIRSEGTPYGRCTFIYREDGSLSEERVGEVVHEHGHDVVKDLDGNRLGTVYHGRIYDNDGNHVGDIADERNTAYSEHDVVRDRPGRNRFPTEVEMLKQKAQSGSSSSSSSAAPRTSSSGGGGGGGGGSSEGSCIGNLVVLLFVFCLIVALVREACIWFHESFVERDRSEDSPYVINADEPGFEYWVDVPLQQNNWSAPIIINGQPGEWYTVKLEPDRPGMRFEVLFPQGVRGVVNGEPGCALAVSDFSSVDELKIALRQKGRVRGWSTSWSPWEPSRGDFIPKNGWVRVAVQLKQGWITVAPVPADQPEQVAQERDQPISVPPPPKVQAKKRPNGWPCLENIAGKILKPGDGCEVHVDSEGFTEWVYLSPEIDSFNLLGWLDDGREAGSAFRRVVVSASNTELNANDEFSKGYFVRYEQAKGQPQPARMTISSKSVLPAPERGEK